MMGRGLDRLKQVPAGCVVAIGGLGTAILKSATLASTPSSQPLAPMLFQVSPAIQLLLGLFLVQHTLYGSVIEWFMV